MNPALVTAARAGFLSVLGLFLVMPLVIVAGVSLNGNARMSFPPVDPGLGWYATFLGDPGWMGAFWNSVAIALGSGVVALAVAMPIAYADWRYGSRLARAMSAVGTMPFMLPPVVLGVLYMIFFGALGHVGRIENVVVGHGIAFAALPLAMLGIGFNAIDRSLLEAAETMGAREEDVLRTIVFPMIAPFVLSSFIFVVILSLNEYIIAYLVAGFTVETLPVKVFNNLRTGFTPAMCVGAVLFAALGLAAFAIVARVGNLSRLLGGKG